MDNKQRSLYVDDDAQERARLASIKRRHSSVQDGYREAIGMWCDWVELGVPHAEQTDPGRSELGKPPNQGLTPDQRKWLGVWARADAVRDKFWKGMLKMIKDQLKHVAKVAAEEAAEDDHDQESEGIRGAAPRGRARDDSGGAVQSIARAKE